MAVIQMPGRKGGDETGMITKWHKKTGDWVEEGDELFSFDTDEGSYTVKSQKAGRLVAVFVPEGEIVHCPADVGMLTTPSPDSVLKLGRQQYLDESKPLEAREPAAPAQEELTAQDEAAEESEETSEEVQEAVEEEAEFSEEELLEYVEDELDEVEAVEEATEEEAEEEEPIVSEEELLQYVEEDISELEQMDEAAEAEVAEEAAEAEAETEDCCEEANCVCARPASVTAQADMELCMDIAARTGVSLGAMVRFAAMHTGLVEYLEDVEAASLRALDERAVLPNVRDLSDTGITAVNAVCTGKVELLVPAVHEAWRVKNDALEVYPCLNLTLAFDENVLELEEAAVMLREVCDKLENLIELLI